MKNAPVVGGDVGNDSRYLPAFGNTLSESDLSILHPATGEVVGAIDVEGDRPMPSARATRTSSKIAQI
jgi:hypothetical protein